MRTGIRFNVQAVINKLKKAIAQQTSSQQYCYVYLQSESLPVIQKFIIHLPINAYTKSYHSYHHWSVN